MPASPVPQIPPLADTRSLLKQVIDTVRWEILSGNYPPGMRLKEVELSARLGVSRPLLREAFQRLHFAGLVTVRDRQGARVMQLTPQELSDVLDFQTTMFAFISRLATINGESGDKQRLLDQATQLERRALLDGYGSIREFTAARYRVQHLLHVCTGSYYRVNKRTRFVSEIMHPHLLLPYLSVEQRQASAQRWLSLARLVVQGDADATEACATQINTVIKAAVFAGLGLAIPEGRPTTRQPG